MKKRKDLHTAVALRLCQLLALGLTATIAIAALGASAEAAEAPQTDRVLSMSDLPVLGPLSFSGEASTANAQLRVSDPSNRERAGKVLPILQRLSDVLDKTQFDAAELNFAKEFSTEALIRFVTQRIHFEQYVGQLRGPEGTLIAGAGNALDQSHLLSVLLEQGGYEWRIVRGKLNDADANRLVHQMSGARDIQAAGEAQALRRLAAELHEALGIPLKDTAPLLAGTDRDASADYLHTTASDTAFLTEALTRAGITMGDPNALAKLVAESQEYYWVEYRIDAYDDWKAAHPAFNGSAPEPVRQASFTQIPEDLAHRFQFTVFLEQKVDQALTVTPIVETTAFATAELFGKPFSFQMTPSNFDVNRRDGIDGLLSDAKRFIPVVNGQVAGQVFDLDGRLYGAGIVSLDGYGMGDVIQSQAKQVEKALGGLKDLGAATTSASPPDDFMTLTGLWIEYTLIAPGGATKTQRRYILDRLGESNRATGTAQIVDGRPLAVAARSLLTEYTIMVIPGRYNPAYALRRYLERTIAELQAFEVIQSQDEIRRWPPAGVGELRPVQDVLLATTFDAGPASSANSVHFWPEPLVVVHESGVSAAAKDAGAYERVDVVNNTRRLFLRDQNGIQPAPQLLLRAGIWDTIAERAPIRADKSKPFTTMDHFRQAQSGNVPLLVLTPDDAGLIASLDHSPLTRINIRNDLASGQIVVIPKRKLGAQSAWWRVDPQTGNALGVAEGGYGSVTIEHISIGVSILFGVASYARCTAEGGGTGCCAADAVIYTSIGLLGGHLIGRLTTLDAYIGYGLGAAFNGATLFSNGLPTTCD